MGRSQFLLTPFGELRNAVFLDLVGKIRGFRSQASVSTQGNYDGLYSPGTLNYPKL